MPINATQREKHIRTDSILEKVSEYDIFKYYMPNSDWKPNIITFSPFRNERNPSFMIGNKHGRLTFIDFADTSKRGSCFDFVKMLFNLRDLKQTLELIDKDFGLGFSKETNTEEYKRIVTQYVQPIRAVKIYSKIQVVARRFNNDELAYWNQYHQSEDDLKANNVYAISKVYLNKQLFGVPIGELRFGYLYEDKWKIYRPYAKDKKSKWVPNNVPITTMDGKDDIKQCDVAFINKSKKDYMVMKKLFPCSCAVQNEGLGCFSPENVEYIKSNSASQILSFDSDITGVENSQQITKIFDFGYCNVPRKYLSEGIKDWADLAKTHGMQAIENYLKEKELL
jgi:DNA primase